MSEIPSWKRMKQPSLNSVLEGRNLVPLSESSMPVQTNNAAGLQLQLFSGPVQGLNSGHQQTFNTVAYQGSDYETGSSAAESRKWCRESDDHQGMQQYTFIPVLDSQQNHGNMIPKSRQTSGGVATGLWLTLDDERTNSSCTTESGQPDVFSHFSSISGVSLARELHQQKDELDQCIKIQVEQMSNAIEEKSRKHLQALLMKVEESVGRKMRDKQKEIENISRHNLELEEEVKQLTREAQAWQSKSKYNEAMVMILKTNLQQAVAQSRELSREGCGESEAEDAASSYQGANFEGWKKQQGSWEGKEQRLCRLCGSRDVCILLLPCMHLCLCKDCEGRPEICPLCRSPMSGSVEVYLS